MIERRLRFAVVLVAVTGFVHCMMANHGMAQSGLRESLEKLDRNQNGEIDPDEITPLARPYLDVWQSRDA